MKTFRRFLIFAATLVVAVSCDPSKSKTDPEIPGNRVDPVNSVLSKSEIAERLDKIGEDMVNVIPVSDIERANAIFNDLAEIDFDSYDEADLDNLSNRYEGKWESCFREWTSKDINFMEIAFDVAKFHGHVTFANGHVEFKDADDFIVTIPSAKGKKVVLTVSHSAETVDVHVKDANDPSSSYKYQDDYYIKVPKVINLVLTYDGEQIVKTDINLEASVSDNMPSIANDSFSIVMSQSILGLNLKVDRVQYAGRKLQLSMGLSYGSKSILAVNASSENVNINDIDEVMNQLESEKLELANSNLSFNIMERAQIAANMPSFNKFFKLMRLAYDNDGNEMQFKSYLGQANDTFNAGLFFSSDVKQASVALEATVSGDGRYWDMEPVLKFSDGTSYSTFSAFFNEVNFSKVMNAIEKWMSDIEDIIG